MVSAFTFVQLAGGLSLFILGIRLLSKGLERYAGAKIQAMIEKLTNRPVKGLLVGALTTATLQSSSLAMVTVIGLINAGLMSLEQALGVVLGAEIGTTITAQIVAFDIGQAYFIPIVAGVVLFLGGRKSKHRHLGQAVLGFGILFLGMDFMSAAMVPLSNEQGFVDLVAYLSINTPLAVLVGAVLTAVIQSSSAMVGTVIAMASAGLISLPAAIGIMLGANIGTCFTSVIASIGSSTSSRRAAVAQVIINVTSVLVFLPVVHPFASFIQTTSNNLPRQIANAHTISNVFISFALLPLSSQIIRMVKKLVPGRYEPSVDVMSMRKDEVVESPELGLKYAEEKLEKVLNITIRMLVNSKRALLDSDKEAAKTTWELEDKVDRLRYVIEDFLDEVSWVDATEEQLKHRMRIVHNTTDMERVGDLAENIANYANEKIEAGIKLSDRAVKDLKKIFGMVEEAYLSAVNSIVQSNAVLANKAIMIEEEVDDLYWKMRDRHVERLERGICDPRAEEIFTNAMRDLERISDHSDNLAKSMIHQLGKTEI